MPEDEKLKKEVETEDRKHQTEASPSVARETLDEAVLLLFDEADALFAKRSKS